tara:strand:+ start:3829 stop:4023 length:195 start_codon:yes stop_codon:yes gene_type:complete
MVKLKNTKKTERTAKYILNALAMFSIYNQKNIIVSIYNSNKKFKKHRMYNQVYENWMTIHNINF